MKTVEEITKKIKKLKKLRDTTDFRSASYYKYIAGIYFLKWVLEDSEDADTEHL